VGLEGTCAVLVSGEARCWGVNSRGQNGTGKLGGETTTPRPVMGIHNAVAISVGFAHRCVQLASGGADCWGYNDYGDLGTGEPHGVYPTPLPVLFPPLLQASGEAAEAGAG
jgi:alpha-tubulin suppressor-like RCC1 family protein